jgi:patched 1 protein
MMSFVLSVGFAVEYSVHTVSRWMRATNKIKSSVDRVEHAMEALMLPMFMSFVSSTIGVICLAFTEFEFNLKFFFKPLLIVMFVTYFMGCWFVPVILCYLDFDVLKMGDSAEAALERDDVKDVEGEEATPGQDEDDAGIETQMENEGGTDAEDKDDD